MATFYSGLFVRDGALESDVFKAFDSMVISICLASENKTQF